MGVHVRAVVDAAELVDATRPLFTAFGNTWSEDEANHAASQIEAERVLVADDDGELVASAGAFTFELTVPGGAFVPVAGVTWVGVLPTHRRQGIATALMRRQLDDVAARGEPIAVLTASEAPIYGRFGYGLAARLAKVRLHTAGGLPLLDDPAPGGRFRLVPADDAVADGRRLLDEVRAGRVGELRRTDSWWPAFNRDAEDDRDGASARYWVVHESAAGAVDGLAHYRVKEHDSGDARASSEVVLGEVLSPDPEVEAALLAYVADVDLTTSVTTWTRPVDDPFRLRLVDDRRYRVELVHDHLYVRVLDVEAALAARTYEYAGDDAVVLGVDDPFRPATSGRYRVAPGGACERVGDLHDGDADAYLRVEALGSLYLGDVTASAMAAAGRLRPSSPSSLAAVDRLFRTPAAPFNTLDF